MRLFLLLPFLLFPLCANAAEPNEFQSQVLECVSLIGKKTGWAECRTMMFAPCSEHKVGSDQHVACLSKELVGWRQTMDAKREVMNEKLTLEGNAMLLDLMREWIGYVDASCEEVAVARVSISSDAARTGCQIAETVGITAEFNICLKGDSIAPYCIFRE